MKLIKLLILILIFNSCTKNEIQNIQPNYIGIDLSHHNPEPNWDELNVDFVILKATEGVGYKDPTFRKRLKECRIHNIYVGAYHFFSGKTSGAYEFENFDNTIPDNLDIIPIIDVEIIHKSISEETFIDNLKFFLMLCYESYGTLPIIYTSENFYNKHLKKLEKCFIDDFTLWFGDINKKYSKFKVKPAIHQYAIKKVDGCVGKVDVNKLYCDLNDILWQKNRKN